MKLNLALIVATLSFSVLVGDTFAQDSDGRMFGNGRFLKKMRDDIFGTKPKLDLPSYESKATKAKKGFSIAGKNVPTPALPTEGNRPAPMGVQSTHQYKASQSQARTSQAQKSLTTNNRSSKYNTSTPKSSVTPKAIESVTRSAKKSTLAFGMLLQTRGQDLVVTQVDPAGNANKAGVRKGDLIVGAGGLELGSMLEFNEITDILEDGDQIEFVVSQNGKKAKKLILFGEAPDMTPREVAQSSRGNSAQTTSRTAQATMASRDSNLNQYQLAPTNSNMHSVIESKDNQFSPMTTPQQQKWKYNSERRNVDRQIEALEAASVRGETILNVPN